jgi:hypothetical protein
MTKLEAALRENQELSDTLMNLVLAISDVANNPKSDLAACHHHFEMAIMVLDKKFNQEKELLN